MASTSASTPRAGTTGERTAPAPRAPLLEPLPSAPTTRRRQHTRMRIVRASLEVFVDKGIEGATIDDLVSAAGFTRGAFYSSFSKKEEVFHALFETVTDEVIATMRSSVDEVIQGHAACGGEGDEHALDEDGRQMLAVFSSIRPFGRQWYLLYSEAVADALRSIEARDRLNLQRHRLRDEIAAHLRRGMESTGETCVIAVEQLAELLVGVFVDLMVQEHLDGSDVTELAGQSIMRILRAFIVPADPDAPRDPAAS